jgi:hypothetical protein
MDATTMAATIQIHAIRDVRDAITITSAWPGIRRVGRQATDPLPGHFR